MLYVVEGRLTHEKPLNEEEIEKVIEPLEDINEEELNEDKIYRGFRIHWVSDKNGGKHVVVFKGKEELGSYDTDDEAVKAINLGDISEEVLDEEFNPFKDLKRLPDETPMKPGLFTDGEGGVYEAPKSGTSKKIKVKGKEFFYDFKTKSLVCTLKDSTPIGLSVSSWLDNPKYWCEKYLDNLNEEMEEKSDEN